MKTSLQSVREKLKKELNKKNVNAVPKVKKVTVNVGVGSFSSKENVKDFSFVEESIAAITGQKPVVRKSKKAISNFKLKIGMTVGYVTTLRGKRMHEFIDRLVNMALPRVRDFRGINPRAFDGLGNYNIGIKDVTIFPEVNPEKLVKSHGVEICINTTAKNDEEGYALLKAMGFPLRPKN